MTVLEGTQAYTSALLERKSCACSKLLIIHTRDQDQELCYIKLLCGAIYNLTMMSLVNSAVHCL